MLKFMFIFALVGCGDNTQALPDAAVDAMPDARPDAPPDADPCIVYCGQTSLEPCMFHICVQERCYHEQPTPCPK